MSRASVESVFEQIAKEPVPVRSGTPEAAVCWRSFGSWRRWFFSPSVGRTRDSIPVGYLPGCSSRSSRCLTMGSFIVSWITGLWSRGIPSSWRGSRPAGGGKGARSAPICPPWSRAVFWCMRMRIQGPTPSTYFFKTNPSAVGPIGRWALRWMPPTENGCTKNRPRCWTRRREGGVRGGWVLY